VRVTLLAPRLPPRISGVGDHTRCLARAMEDQAVEAGYIHRDPQQELDVPEGPPDRRDGGRRSLCRVLSRQASDWLWVELSGYGCSRWGAPYRLGRVLASRLLAQALGSCASLRDGGIS
jgi:hypothetical protein